MFKIKAESAYKGRLAFQGVLKIPGVDCGATFTPVCKIQSTGMMLAIAAELDCEVHTLDLQMAFLNAKVEEDVFVKMAPDFETSDKAVVYLVIKLKKSLYGLRQNPKNWFGPMDVKLTVIGSHPLKSDLCVYIHADETGFVVLALYVDDILL